MDSFKNVYDKNLPDRCVFYSFSKNECFSEKDYLHVSKSKTMGDYHDIYLKTDVLLSADVFEKFINMCLYYYKLDQLF